GAHRDALFPEGLAAQPGRRPQRVPAVCRGICGAAGGCVLRPPLSALDAAVAAGHLLSGMHCLGQRAGVCAAVVAVRLLQRPLWAATAAGGGRVRGPAGGIYREVLSAAALSGCSAAAGARRVELRLSVAAHADLAARGAEERRGAHGL